MKNVLLISNYFHLKNEKEINRYRILAEKICDHSDISLEVITSKFYQRTLKMREITPEIISSLPYRFTTIYEPGYSKTVSLQRLKSSRIFAKNVVAYLETLNQIDLIYQVVPTLDVACEVIKFAKRKKIPVIIDVQDLWPEAFRIALDIPIISTILFLPYKHKANYIYKNADDICSVSNTFLKRAMSVNKRKINGHAVYIGVNLSEVDEYCKEITRNNQNCFTIAYCGSLGKSYDLETVLSALSKIDLPIKLLIMGDGDKKEKLEALANSLKLNVEFTGFINYKEMSIRLRQSDVVINPIIGKSTGSIINKHGDYVASGRPILNTQNCEEFVKLIDDYNMGLNSPSGDVDALARNIVYLFKNPQVRLNMGKNARKCAEERFDRNVTYNELVDAIINQLSKGAKNDLHR